jgi:hypothetical protein
MPNFFAKIFRDIKDFFHESDESIEEDAEGQSSQKPELLKLKIVSSIFGYAVISVVPVANGFNVKRSALMSFMEDESFINIQEMIDYFKLIRVATRQEFGDFKFLGTENVKNREEFLLVKKRDQDDEFQFEFLMGTPKNPTKPLFPKSSSEVSQKSNPVFHAQSLVVQNFNRDLRKVVITLAQFSVPILASGPYAIHLIYYYRQKIRGQLQTHEQAIKVLENLGFEKEFVEKSLQLKANNYIAALDWLIDNAPINKKDEPEAGPKRSSISSLRGSQCSSRRHSSIVSSTFTTPQTLAEKIDGLLEIIKFYSEKEEVPSKEQIDSLLEMGFQEDFVRDALRMTRNDEASAVEWMLGKRSPSLTELREGLSDTSKVRKELQQLSDVQQSLGNPATFVAYMMILKDYKNIKYYIEGSASTSAMFEHIIKCYHDNKQYSAIEQFNGSRLPISALSAPNN